MNGCSIRKDKILVVMKVVVVVGMVSGVVLSWVVKLGDLG